MLHNMLFTVFLWYFFVFSKNVITVDIKIKYVLVCLLIVHKNVV